MTGKTAENLESTYNNNTVTLKNADLNTQVTIGGTAAFDFDSDVTGHKITGSAAADRVTLEGESNVFTAAAGNDYIVISGAANSINAGAGNDRILVNSANNSIVAGDGADYIVINNTAGNSINAGKGNDYIDLGTGANTFIYYNGDGNDTIANFASDSAIKVANVKAANIKVTAANDDVIVKVNSATIRLKNAATNIADIKVYGSDSGETPIAATANVLADDNYSVTPQLSSIVKGSSGYMTEDLVATDATSLTKQNTAIAYGGKK